MKNFIFISPHFPDSYWKFCLALKNRGFNVLGIGDAPYFEIPDQCKFALTEYYCCQNMDDYENERRAVQYFKDKYGNIGFLESNNEYWLEKDARLREEFNITSGANTSEVKYFKHKSLQKEIFIKAGCKVARFILVDENKENLLNFAKEVGYPLFAKPDNGVGSHGTFKIKNSEDLEVFYLKCPKDRSYIVEEYVDGRIISFDGISNSKGDVIFSTWDIFLDSVANIVNDNLDDMYYCDPNIDPVFDKIGRKVVKAFNLKNRFFHIEFFRLNNDHPYLGKKGTYIPLEGNMRPAGGYTPDLINYANSISVYDIYADSVAYDENREVRGDKTYIAITSSRRYAINYVHSKEEINEKYKRNITMSGDYPLAIRDAMGDYYYFAKFDTLEEALNFDKFVRERK
ncbi:MAG: ATP-grasp domain-containing protein [Firmicutes bacterium]|uniref:ATP-grasp domain-containing protein n=1 Tax=Candidatus Onthovivens merdipullorum TaxID=2840889 RepID=A0A9D9DHK9_9BACL|nr:ATP-grasp domain-containing protein [Candidatus Onthovivens merdipullorum]